MTSELRWVEDGGDVAGTDVPLDHVGRILGQKVASKPLPPPRKPRRGLPPRPRGMGQRAWIEQLVAVLIGRRGVTHVQRHLEREISRTPQRRR